MVIPQCSNQARGSSVRKPWKRHCEDTPDPKYLNYLEGLRKGCRPPFSHNPLLSESRYWHCCFSHFHQPVCSNLKTYSNWCSYLSRGFFFLKEENNLQSFTLRKLYTEAQVQYSQPIVVTFTFAVLDWHAWLCYLRSNYGLEAALQVFAHCPSAWPSYNLYSNFLLRSRKQGWYPASLYSLAYPAALQTRAPSTVRCEGDRWDLGTKHRLLKSRHWEVIELHSRQNQGWTHTCFTGTTVRQTFLPPGSIKSYAKFTDSFQNKLKRLWSKIIFDLCNKWPSV